MKKEKRDILVKGKKGGHGSFLGRRGENWRTKKEKKTFEKSKKRHERKKEELLLTERGRD